MYDKLDPRYIDKRPRLSGIPYGMSSLDVWNEGRKIRCLTYKPESYSAGRSGILVMFHGTSRVEELLVDYNRTFAAQHGLLLVAPKWSDTRFPATEYHRLGVTPDDTSAGPITLWPKTMWLIQDIEYVLKDIYIRDAIDNTDDVPLYFFGHSAGGQVLHRLRLLWPDCRARLVAGNPGIVTPAYYDYFYPWGLSGLDTAYFGADQIKRWVEGEVILFNGDEDTEEYWATNATARQGSNRYDRVKCAYETAARMAFENGWTFRWKEVVVPGVAHIAYGLINSAQAQEAFFEPVEPQVFDTFPNPVELVASSGLSNVVDTSVSVTIPSAVADGDLLIAWVIARSAVTPPAGWTLVASQACVSTANSVTQTLYAYSRVAQAGDANTAATWAQATSARCAAHIQAYRRPEGVGVVAHKSAALDDTIADRIAYPSPVATVYGQRIAMASTTISLTGSPSLAMSFKAGGYGSSGDTTPTNTRMTCGNLITYKGQINASSWVKDSAQAGNGMAAISLLLG